MRDRRRPPARGRGRGRIRACGLRRDRFRARGVRARRRGGRRMRHAERRRGPPRERRDRAGARGHEGSRRPRRVAGGAGGRAPSCRRRRALAAVVHVALVRRERGHAEPAGLARGGPPLLRRDARASSTPPGSVSLTAPDTTQIAEAAFEESLPPARASGTQSGVLLSVASGVSIVANYAFLLAAGRILGSDDYGALAALYVFPFVLRLALLAVVASAGYRLGGAMLATVVATIAGTAVAIGLIREPLSRGAARARPGLRTFLRYLGPVGVGLVGIALLTHVDILVVKARFSADEAGAYAAASAFARVGFFVPATILAVLFPRTAARQARGEETEDILGRSLLATAAFCAALALFYAAAGVGLVVTTFGPDFAEGGHVLAPFALAIGLFSVANILVGYHLSRGETRYAWIVGGGVLAQVVILAVLPSSLRGVVWWNVVIGVALLVAHELVVGSSARAIRAGFRHVQAATVALRGALPEAGIVLLGTTAFVCALYWRVVIHLGSTIIGIRGSDSTATVAAIWETRHEGGYHLLGTTHHTLTGAPFGWDETNARNVQVMLAYYPTYLLAKIVGDVAAFNLITLAGYVLPGATMYLLVRYLGGARLVADWAALVFIVFPWHLARAEHASLLHV